MEALAITAGSLFLWFDDIFSRNIHKEDVQCTIFLRIGEKKTNRITLNNFEFFKNEEFELAAPYKLSGIMLKARQRFSMRSRLGLVLDYQRLRNQVIRVP